MAVTVDFDFAYFLSYVPRVLSGGFEFVSEMEAMGTPHSFLLSFKYGGVLTPPWSSDAYCLKLAEELTSDGLR